jgi:hypothetical protein
LADGPMLVSQYPAGKDVRATFRIRFRLGGTT